jgi:hypothetical protein
MQRREVADLGRERAVDLVAEEVPAGKGRSRAAPGVGDAGGTRRFRRFASLPISVGIVPLIWLP